MLTFLAVAEARHRDLQREVTELRLRAAAYAVDPAPPGPSASERRAQTLSSLRTISSSKGGEPCLSTPYYG